MKNNNSNLINILSYAVLTFVVCLVTVFLGFYLVDQPYRDVRFGVSLGSILFGEILVFFQSARIASGERVARSFVFRLSGLAGPLGYLFIATALSLLALNPAVSSKLLVLLHVILLLIALLASVVSWRAAEAADDSQETAFPANSTLKLIKDNMRIISDRASLHPDFEVRKIVISNIKKLKDEIQFSYGQSDDASAKEDTEVLLQLDYTMKLFDKLEKSPDQKTFSELTAVTEVALVALRRRNDGLNRRR
jgi:hypothetical protein